jgi:hypothetical protein
MGLLDRFRRFGTDVSGDIHPDGVGELHVGDARFDDWEVVKDFDDLETARAFHQALTDAGMEAEITSDYEVNQYGRGRQRRPSRLLEQLVRLAPHARRNPERDVAAAELVELVVGGDLGLHAGVGQRLVKGPRRLEVVEVLDHLPVVEAGVTDVQLADAVGMDTTTDVLAEAAEAVEEAHAVASR